MADMYCTFEDVAELTGASPEDFRYLNKSMNYEQFRDLIERYIVFASSSINKYCNMKSFNLHTVEDELHSVVISRDFPLITGAPSPMIYGMYDTSDDYSKLSREVFPREYPVNSIDKVEVSYQLNTGGQEWVELTERKTGQNGDYNVISRFDHKHIQISKSVPRYGINNCKLTYTAGYPEDHLVWEQIRMACVMIVNNVLNYKKASQEAYTIRGSSIQDYSPMFNGDSGNVFISREIALILDRWRRPYATPDCYI